MQKLEIQRRKARYQPKQLYERSTMRKAILGSDEADSAKSADYGVFMRGQVASCLHLILPLRSIHHCGFRFVFDIEVEFSPSRCRMTGTKALIGEQFEKSSFGGVLRTTRDPK